jgi:hypothetical protein
MKSFSRLRSLGAVASAAVLALALAAFSQPEQNGTMLILRGIANAENPRGQLDDDSAEAYAWYTGYEGEVLDIAGGTAQQVRETLARIRSDERVTALYGFSGGAYATVRIWRALSPEEKERIEYVVIVGAPGVSERSFPGASQVMVQPDPPEGHLQGPRVLLEGEQ